MNKLKLLLVVLLAACLVRIDIVRVQPYPASSTHSVKYDAARDVYVYTWTMFIDAWCTNEQSHIDSISGKTCLDPSTVPPKKEILVTIRDDVVKGDYWQYVTATVYIGRPRVPNRQTDAFGNTRYLFDSSRLPFVPPRMEVVMHNGAKFEWAPYKVKVYSLKDVPSDGLVSGYDLLRELAGQKTLDGTTLEYLLSTPRLIPQECCGRMTLFLGTIYQDKAQTYYCSALFCNSGKWMAMIHPLDYKMWPSGVSAAVFT